MTPAGHGSPNRSTAKAAWEPATDFLTAAERAERSAEYLQHMFACNVGEVFREDVVTIAAVARTAELNAGSLGHVLHTGTRSPWQR